MALMGGKARAEKPALVLALAIGALVGMPPGGAETQARSGKTPPGPPYRALLLMEAHSGQVLVEDNAHEQRPPASMVKMMLMLIVADKVTAGELSWDDPIIASREAERMGGSQVYLATEETFSLRELMEAVVIASANDASLAVAEAVGGSRDGFVELMNERARQLGLRNTVYHSPHGLPPGKDQDSDLSTAHDLALVARELLKHPQLMAWSDTAESTFRNGTFKLLNTNHLIRTTPWVNGIKTGYTREAGFNLTATGERNGMVLIGVVMGAPTKQTCSEEAVRLLNRGFNGFQPHQAVRKGDVIANDVPVRGGDPRFVRIVAGDDLAVVSPRGAKPRFTLDLVMPGELQAPLDAAARVGSVVIRQDGREIGQVPALAGDAVEKQRRFWERFF
jgi:D-alanyl-D-alanine carboxypeptidase (penicillin-binding protein 5/6)